MNESKESKYELINKLRAKINGEPIIYQLLHIYDLVLLDSSKLVNNSRKTNKDLVYSYLNYSNELILAFDCICKLKYYENEKMFTNEDLYSIAYDQKVLIDKLANHCDITLKWLEPPEVTDSIYMSVLEQITKLNNERKGGE